MKPAEDKGTVVCQVDMLFVESEAEGAVKLLLSVIERIAVKTGCESCSVARNLVDPAGILYAEVWSSESLFRSHVKSKEFQNVLVAMDMCCARPQVVIGRLPGPTGIEYLRDLRGDLEPAWDAESFPEFS